MQFIPAHWLELAYWNRPMIVCSRTIPDPQGRLSIDRQPSFPGRQQTAHFAVKSGDCVRSVAEEGRT